jgi:hypothetical protein
MSDSPVSPEDIRAAAETYQELGPEYHDAIVASFLDKVDREVAARVEARLAGTAQAQPPAPAPRRKRRLALTRKRVLRDAAAATVGALAVVTAVAVHHGGAGGPTSFPVHARAFRVGVNGPGGQVIKRGPNGDIQVDPAPKAPAAPPAP